MSFTVAPIVEGRGEVEALPVLLRRMAPTLRIARPVRFPRSQLIIPDHLVRAAAIASANITHHGAILVVLDTDEDCAAALGPQLERQLCARVPNRVCRVVLPVREFEAWIVGGIASYGVDNPDMAGDLKGRIKAARRGVYKETVDQPKLIAAADTQRLVAVSRSFQRLKKVVDEFLAMDATQGGA